MIALFRHSLRKFQGHLSGLAQHRQKFGVPNRYLWPLRLWPSWQAMVVDLVVFVLEFKRVVGFRRYFLPSWWRDREKRKALRHSQRSVMRREWDTLLDLERKRMARIEAAYDREQEAKK